MGVVEEEDGFKGRNGAIGGRLWNALWGRALEIGSASLVWNGLGHNPRRTQGWQMTPEPFEVLQNSP